MAIGEEGLWMGKRTSSLMNYEILYRYQPYPALNTCLFALFAHHVASFHLYRLALPLF